MIHTDKKHSVRFAKHLLEAHLNTSEATKIKLEGKVQRPWKPCFREPVATMPSKCTN